MKMIDRYVEDIVVESAGKNRSYCGRRAYARTTLGDQSGRSEFSLAMCVPVP